MKTTVNNIGLIDISKLDALMEALKIYQSNLMDIKKDKFSKFENLSDDEKYKLLCATAQLTVFKQVKQLIAPSEKFINLTFDLVADTIKNNSNIIPTPYRMSDDDYTIDYNDEEIEKYKQEFVKKDIEL